MRSLKIFFLPVLAVAITAAVFALPARETEARSPRTVTVAQSSFACPIAGDTTVATGRVAAHTGTRATATALPDKLSVDALTPVDSWNNAKVVARSVVVNTIDSQGAGAVGFFGAIASSKDGGGLGVGSCPAVVQDAWYVGGGSGAKHFSTLTLTNLSDSTAVADVSLWGEKGTVDAVNAEGIVLDAFETRSIPLDSLAAGEPELAVHVLSRRGAFSVAMRDTSTAAFRGTEPLAETAAPARRQVIAGIASGANDRQLVAFNPGNATARVKIEVLGNEGALVPTGLEDVKIAAGRVKVMDVPKSAGGGALALRLTADHPLSASVRSSPSNKDFAYAVAGQPLVGPAVAPLSIGNILQDAQLLLTAPGAKADVTITAYDDDMTKQGSVDVAVKAGSTTSYDLGAKGRFDKPLGDLAYVIVNSSGNVQGAALYTRGDGVSALPLTTAPLKTLAPQVRPGR